VAYDEGFLGIAHEILSAPAQWLGCPEIFSALRCATRSLLDFYRERIKRVKTRPPKLQRTKIIISRFFLPGAAGGDRRMASAIIFLSSSLKSSSRID